MLRGELVYADLSAMTQGLARIARLMASGLGEAEGQPQGAGRITFSIVRLKTGIHAHIHQHAWIGVSLAAVYSTLSSLLPSPPCRFAPTAAPGYRDMQLLLRLGEEGSGPGFGLLAEVQLHLQSILALKESGKGLVGPDGLSGHQRYTLSREGQERRQRYREYALSFRAHTPGGGGGVGEGEGEAAGDTAGGGEGAGCGGGGEKG